MTKCRKSDYLSMLDYNEQLNLLFITFLIVIVGIISLCLFYNYIYFLNFENTVSRLLISVR